jgi:DNA modification methylase
MEKPELDFDKQNTLYATHGLHAFAAKCPPQLVGYALDHYSQPGELILDPMVGSGTALVEARIKGRNAIGYDFDPLARLIAQVKSQIVDDNEIEAAEALILRDSAADFALIKSAKVPAELISRYSPPDFHNRDYWFDPDVSIALTILSHYIVTHPFPPTVKDFLWVAFSSLIIARTSVANARDIIHSRHHHYLHPQQPDVLARFAARIKIMRRQMIGFRNLCAAAPSVSWAEAHLGDARQLELEDESVDLVFTSPPYATALDYPRAHFLAIPWMQAALSVNLDGYRTNAPSYIGSQQGRLLGPLQIDPRLAQLSQTPTILTELAANCMRQAKLCHRYFVDMDRALSEIARVLKDKRHAVIVVCPSHIRKTAIPTQDVLVELGQTHNLHLTEKHVRTINERRRVMPYMSAFGTRMSTEYVLVFQKR